jgi:hypothetical protein
MYKITPSGRIFDSKGAEIPLDDRDDRYLAYLLWLSGDRAPEPFDAPPAPPTPAEELAAAQAWGQELVRAVEIDLMRGGINADPRAALAVDRELREISDALKGGRLHVAAAALDELLGLPQEQRAASDALLTPVHTALRERIGQGGA